MPPPSDRRSRKRLATRQGISDVATRLFLARGVDRVTGAGPSGAAGARGGRVGGPDGGGRAPDDPAAHLAAGLFLATWTVAVIEAHRTFRRRFYKVYATTEFFTMVDQGTVGLKAALAGTPYV